MWTHYRKWKHAFFWPLAILAGIFLKEVDLPDREKSFQFYAGLAIVLSLGVAYLVEEMVWMAQRKGRPCGHCGQRVQMKSFSVRMKCPHCGLPLG